MLDIDFNQIVNMIENRRSKAYKKVNEEMVLLYLDIGKFLYDLKSNSGYGDKIVAKAAEFMKSNYPQLRGFTKRNLERMIQFYSTYKEDEIATPLVTQLSWTNNLLILSGAKTKEERYFYLKLAIKNNYSKRELDRQITSSYYERFILSEGKQLPTIKKTVDEDDYPNTRLLDTYSLEFLDLPNEYNEMDLKKSIIRNLKDFILEIGNDFTYIGDEYMDVLADGNWEKTFTEKPSVFTKEEKRAWLDQMTEVTLGSDAFFPFSDNIERAHKSGVKYIAQPGGSVRDADVIETCNKYNMAMAFTGIRLFHH